MDPWFVKLVDALPSLTRRIQVFGLAIGVGGVVIMRTVDPNAVVAQVAVGAIGVGVIFFGQIFAALKDYPRADRARITQNVFFGFLLFLLALIIVIALFPPQPVVADPDSVSIGFAGEMSLREVVDQLSEEKNVTVIFLQCPPSTENARVQGGTHSGRDPGDFLRRIQQRILDVGVKYDVRQAGPQRYELVCG
jgi:hypothetical protein